MPVNGKEYVTSYQSHTHVIHVLGPLDDYSSYGTIYWVVAWMVPGPDTPFRLIRA